MIIPLAECQAHCSLGRSYVGLMTDVPHILFELTLTVIQDVLIGLLVWPWMRRLARKWRQDVHEEIDQEHGVQPHREEFVDKHKRWRGQRRPPHAKLPTVTKPRDRVGAGRGRF